jgi:hypothetical protein
MPDIKDLLSRFQSMLSTGEGRKEVVVEAIKKSVGIEVKTEDIEIKGNIVFLKIKPIYKNEVLLKKEKILSSFKDSLGSKAPEDVR